MTDLTGKRVPPFRVVPLESPSPCVLPDAFVGQNFVVHFYNAG